MMALAFFWQEEWDPWVDVVINYSYSTVEIAIGKT
jgi:hypothetical protein